MSLLCLSRGHSDQGRAEQSFIRVAQGALEAAFILESLIRRTFHPYLRVPQLRRSQSPPQAQQHLPTRPHPQSPRPGVASRPTRESKIYDQDRTPTPSRAWLRSNWAKSAALLATKTGAQLRQSLSQSFMGNVRLYLGKSKASCQLKVNSSGIWGRMARLHAVHHTGEVAQGKEKRQKDSKKEHFRGIPVPGCKWHMSLLCFPVLVAMWTSTPVWIPSCLIC